MTRNVRAAALSACVAALCAAASAHADDAIKARQGFMTLLGAEVGPLGAMAKGEAPYDAAKA